MKPRIIALYLPQFHPIPENDRWWGPGFTEWTNVANAKPIFRGHIQPKIPADLGFYDLRLSETREAQAELAREAGIEGFCYYHYWFGGKELLNRPFKEVLESGKPVFPFCLCWANHSWSNKTWQTKSALHGDSMLIEQTYPGEEDDTNHFYSILPALKDSRYIKVDGKPVFFLYDPISHPDVTKWMALWRSLAQQNGLPGIFFVAMSPSTLSFKINEDGSHSPCLPNLSSSREIFQQLFDKGFDAVNSFGRRRGEMLYGNKYSDLFTKILRRAGIPIGRRKDYSRIVKNFFSPEDKWENVFPTVLPNWDNTPRRRGIDPVYINATPSNFQKHLENALEIIKGKDKEHQIVVIKSWNEWGEGNYLEPDQEFGHGWLDAVKKATEKYSI